MAEDRKQLAEDRTISLGFAIGLIVGSILLALTGAAVWIALGPVIGAGAGYSLARTRRQP